MKFAGYMLSLAFVVVAFGFAPSRIASGAAAAAHKFHTSFTEANYNAKEGSLEITLRTFPDDLENILRRRRGRPVRLDQKQEAERFLLDYVRETFQLKNAKGETVKLSWVGIDAGVDSAWLYFEAHMPEGCAGAQLRNQFMFDLFDDQINLVNIKQDDKKRALTFKNGDGFQSLTPQ